MDRVVTGFLLPKQCNQFGLKSKVSGSWITRVDPHIFRGLRLGIEKRMSCSFMGQLLKVFKNNALICGTKI